MNETDINKIGANESGEAPDSKQTPEQLIAENNALKQMMRLRDAREELTAVLAEKGAKSPGLLFAYAVDDLQFDEEEKLANVSALVRKLERSFPEQFEERIAVPSINGGAGKPNQPAALTRESLEKMRPSEIARLDWNEVKRVLVNQ